MRRFILPALLAGLFVFAIAPSPAQASWLSEALHAIRGDQPAYPAPVYASDAPGVDVVPAPPVYVPPPSYVPAPPVPYGYPIYPQEWHREHWHGEHGHGHAEGHGYRGHGGHHR